MTGEPCIKVKHNCNLTICYTALYMLDNNFWNYDFSSLCGEYSGVSWGVHSVRLHPGRSKRGAKKEGRKRKKQGKGEKKGKKRGAKEGEKGRERKYAKRKGKEGKK